MSKSAKLNNFLKNFDYIWQEACLLTKKQKENILLKNIALIKRISSLKKMTKSAKLTKCLKNFDEIWQEV